MTLTLRQAIICNGTWVSLSQYDASRNLRHFLNLLNKKVFRSAKKCSLGCYSVLEGDDDIRKHYHLLLEMPESVTVEKYAYLIQNLWSQTLWGYNKVDVKSANEGWLRYMSKYKNKTVYSDAIDWENCRLAVKRAVQSGAQ